MFRVFGYAALNLLMLGMAFWNMLLCAWWAIAYTVTGKHYWLIGQYSTDKLLYTSVAFVFTAILTCILASSTNRVAQEEKDKIQQALEYANRDE